MTTLCHIKTHYSTFPIIIQTPREKLYVTSVEENKGSIQDYRKEEGWRITFQFIAWGARGWKRANDGMERNLMSHWWLYSTPLLASKQGQSNTVTMVALLPLLLAFKRREVGGSVTSCTFSISFTCRVFAPIYICNEEVDDILRGHLFASIYICNYFICMFFCSRLCITCLNFGVKMVEVSCCQSYLGCVIKHPAFSQFWMIDEKPSL